MTQQTAYKYLEPWPEACTSYRGLFFKGRRLRADYIYGQAVGEDARTPEELAHDFDLPLEAVREAIHYCTHNEEFLRQERERENARLAEFDRKQKPLQPPPDLAGS
jgi:uncharacterized protein (DUF433 family)